MNKNKSRGEIQTKRKKGVIGLVMAEGGEDNAVEFYLRYYVGHKGKFGHEFLEFEFRPDGKLRYANNSNYKNDTMIRKEVFLTPAALKECRRIVSDSEVFSSLSLSLSRYLSYYLNICTCPLFLGLPQLLGL